MPSPFPFSTTFLLTPPHHPFLLPLSLHHHTTLKTLSHLSFPLHSPSLLTSPMPLPPSHSFCIFLFYLFSLGSSCLSSFFSSHNILQLCSSSFSLFFPVTFLSFASFVSSFSTYDLQVNYATSYLVIFPTFLSP